MRWLTGLCFLRGALTFVWLGGQQTPTSIRTTDALPLPACWAGVLLALGNVIAILVPTASWGGGVCPIERDGGIDSPSLEGAVTPTALLYCCPASFLQETKKKSRRTLCVCAPAITTTYAYRAHASRVPTHMLFRCIVESYSIHHTTSPLCPREQTPCVQSFSALPPRKGKGETIPVSFFQRSRCCWLFGSPLLFDSAVILSTTTAPSSRSTWARTTRVGVTSTSPRSLMGTGLRWTESGR